MSTKAKRPAYLLRVGKAHARLLMSAVLGIVTALVLPGSLSAITRTLIGWDAGVLIYLAAAAVVMTRCSSASAMQDNAAAQDEGGVAILFLAVAAAIASLGAIFAELATLERSSPNYAIYVALAIIPVLLSWTFTHTIFALHYAHEFYGEHLRKSGLEFPGDGSPDY